MAEKEISLGLKAMIKLEAMRTERAGMIAENTFLESQGETIKYGEEAFNALAGRMEDLLGVKRETKRVETKKQKVCPICNEPILDTHVKVYDDIERAHVHLDCKCDEDDRAYFDRDMGFGES